MTHPAPRTTTPRPSRAAGAVLAPVLLVLALIAAACGGPAGGSAAPTGPTPSGSVASQAEPPGDLVPVRLGVAASTGQAAKVADARGIFEAHGLDVELVELANGPAIQTALVNGSVDVGHGDVFAWLSSVLNGFDVDLLTPSNGPSYGNRVLVREGSGITGPQDLVGQAVGVSQTALTSVLARSWLAAGGVDPDAVEWVQLPADGAAEALESERVAAILAQDPYIQQYQQRYGFEVVGETPSLAVPQGASIAGYYATGEWAADHADTAQAVVDALREAATWYLAASSRERAEVVTQYLGVDLISLDEQIPGIIEGYHDPVLQPGPVDVEATQAWAQVGVEQGGLASDVAVADHLFETATR